MQTKNLKPITMKTSNKTKTRLAVIIMVVMSLVSVSLNAQKANANYLLASLAGPYISFDKYEILHSIVPQHSHTDPLDLNPLEDWMMNPSQWTDKSSNEEEIAIESWMYSGNWENTGITDDEIEIESWMYSTDWKNTNEAENEIMLESWMTNLQDWN